MGPNQGCGLFNFLDFSLVVERQELQLLPSHLCSGKRKEEATKSWHTQQLQILSLCPDGDTWPTLAAKEAGRCTHSAGHIVSPNKTRVC